MKTGATELFNTMPKIYSEDPFVGNGKDLSGKYIRPFVAIHTDRFALW